MASRRSFTPIYFNPRTYTRCDRRAVPIGGDEMISIHAPTRGAMMRKTDSSSIWWNFNPRTYVRCDERLRKIVLEQLLFQSTHLHEVRFAPNERVMLAEEFQSTHLHEVRFHPSGRSASLAYFNPRTCTRCDWMDSTHTVLSSIFQSTHLHEVRSRSGHRQVCQDISIHAPARGAIEFNTLLAQLRQISIHAPARGAIGLRAQQAFGGVISIHAPARGAIHAVVGARCPLSFQSTHLHEVRSIG